MERVSFGHHPVPGEHTAPVVLVGGVAHHVGLVQQGPVALLVGGRIGPFLAQAGQDHHKAHIGVQGTQGQHGLGGQQVKAHGAAADKVGAAVVVKGGNVPQKGVVQGPGAGGKLPVTGENTDLSHSAPLLSTLFFSVYHSLRGKKRLSRVNKS